MNVPKITIPKVGIVAGIVLAIIALIQILGLAAPIIAIIHAFGG